MRNGTGFSATAAADSPCWERLEYEEAWASWTGTKVSFHMTLHLMGTLGGRSGRHLVEPTSQGASPEDEKIYSAEVTAERRTTRNLRRGLLL